MQAGSPMLRAQFTDLFVSRLAYIDEILFENFDAPTLTYPQVFNVRSSNRAHEEVTGITGFDQFTEKSEADTITYDQLLQGFDKRFTHKTFAKGYAISAEANEDDLDNIISNAFPALARVARNSIETEVFADLNNGFSSATTPDGVAAFSASHPLVGGGIFSNLISGDFAQGTLENAINIFDDMRDDRNQLIEVSPAMLVYPPALRWIINEVLKSQLRSDTANNTINVVNQLGLRTVMVKYLTSDTDWFVFGDQRQTRLLLYWRKEPVTDHTMDFDTGNLKTKMTYRLSHGYADWRGLVGGDGT